MNLEWITRFFSENGGYVYSLFLPPFGQHYCLFPPPISLLALGLFDLWNERFFGGRELKAAPVDGADGFAGEEGGAANRRLGIVRRRDRLAEEIGLGLNEVFDLRAAAACDDLPDRDRSFHADRPVDVGHQKGDPFDRAADQIFLAAGAGQSKKRGLDLIVPVRRAEADQRGEEKDPLARLGAGGIDLPL